MYSYLVGAAICAGACAGDLRDYKIPNGLILLGYAAGSFYTYLRVGSRFFPAFALNALWPLILLYFLFFTGAVGSGDIKLISVLSSFLRPPATLRLIILSFAIGAVFALAKMTAAGDLTFRLTHLRQHVFACAVQRKLVPYVSVGRCRELHFAVSISISYLIIIFQAVCGL